nr:hypothetical protein [Elizabethkingia sp. ASV34]
MSKIQNLREFQGTLRYIDIRLTGDYVWNNKVTLKPVELRPLRLNSS